ncbi:hypothetical protein Y1Q_0021174 [Alligator mississippiensis]|uniref:RING-type E3 ubiquitin transferase n=1 Tax=Alligator mississippiensis TaxID=8496 RepID=A0A151MZU8_ALLMI|nr:hypothetical protein Y1Q_0021174 [Alligator mississippiensis]
MEYKSYPRDHHTMDSLERQLICPICLEVFTKPVVILPCQHNLCRKCANDIFQSRGTTLGSAGRFRCPSCRHEVVLDRHGVYGLQRNLLVENIIDIYKQESARCPNSSRPLLKTEQPRCEEHEEERINIYCVTCRVPTCSLCKVFGEHKDCEVAPLSDIYMQQKTELTDGIGALVAANDGIQAFIGRLQGTCKNIEDNCKAQKQALCEKFDRMYAILEERRKIMLQRITYEQEEKTQHVKSLARLYGDRVESASKLVDTALQSMEEPQMAVFVQNARVLIQKISEVTQSCQLEEMESGYDNMEHYAVDFNAEERVLYHLDFIRVEEEPGEEGEEDAEGTAAESARAEGTASQGEGQDNVIPNGKEEEEEGKASTMKEAECDAAGEADGMAAPLGLAQFGSVAQAGKEAAEGDPGPGQQKDAAALDGELNAAVPDAPGFLGHLAPPSHAKGSALETPSLGNAETEEAAGCSRAEAITSDSSAGSKSDDLGKSCVAGAAPGERPGAEKETASAPCQPSGAGLGHFPETPLEHVASPWMRVCSINPGPDRRSSRDISRNSRSRWKGFKCRSITKACRILATAATERQKNTGKQYLALKVSPARSQHGYFTKQQTVQPDAFGIEL